MIWHFDCLLFLISKRLTTRIARESAKVSEHFCFDYAELQIVWIGATFSFIYKGEYNKQRAIVVKNDKPNRKSSIKPHIYDCSWFWSRALWLCCSQWIKGSVAILWFWCSANFNKIWFATIIAQNYIKVRLHP